MNPHKAHPASPIEMVLSFWRNYRLILHMTKREIIGRYRGSMMGLAWSIFYPILMLTVYTFVFSVVFEAKWRIDQTETRADFAIILFVGMIVHGLISDCINRSPVLITSNVNFVKKVVFPLDILPWVTMGTALFYCMVSTAVLLSAQLLLNQTLPMTSILFPLVLFPLILAGMGFTWFLAALGVFVRDIGQITGVITTILMFISPVFYPVSALPIEFQYWLKINPLTLIIEESRKVLIFGVLPDWTSLFGIFILSLIIAALGFWWFQKTRKGFADVI